MSRHQVRGGGRKPETRLRRMRAITVEYHAEKARWIARVEMLRIRNRLVSNRKGRAHSCMRIGRRSFLRYLAKLERLRNRFYRIIATGNLKEYWLL